MTSDGCGRWIDEIPGPAGWVFRPSRDAFQSLADRLHRHGLTCSETADVLARAYAAVTHELSQPAPPGACPGPLFDPKAPR